MDRYGVFYAAHDLETAIGETRYHRERFMQATQQDRMELDMRVYTLALNGTLHDIRGQKKKLTAVYSSYGLPSRAAAWEDAA